MSNCRPPSDAFLKSLLNSRVADSPLFAAARREAGLIAAARCSSCPNKELRGEEVLLTLLRAAWRRLEAAQPDLALSLRARP